MSASSQALRAAPLATRLGAESFVSLETFRKDGTGVKTPVWVAQFTMGETPIPPLTADLDGKLVVVTDGTSFKVKRIRNDPRIRLAPCSRRGAIRGDWVDGSARVIDDAEHAARADALLARKYGVQMWIHDVAFKLLGRFERRCFLELSV